jgi:hypothetical protein
VNIELKKYYSGSSLNIYTNSTPCDPYSSNHAIIAVGWGTDATAGPYWIVTKLVDSFRFNF